MSDISQAEKDYIHNQHVAEARAHLETLMDAKNLPEASRDHLRDVFQGVSHIGGVRQAVKVQKRMGVPQ